MKKTMKSILALAVCAVAMGFVSCSDDDVNSADGNKEYLFGVDCELYKVEGDETGEVKDQQQKYLKDVFTTVGLVGETAYPLSISGKDSASVSKVLLEKMAYVEKAIADAPFEINVEVYVKGAEKSLVNSDAKEGNFLTLWYEKTFGTPSNDEGSRDGVYFRSPHNHRCYVKWLRTTDSYFDSNGDYWTKIATDLNLDVRVNLFVWAPSIYLILEHSGFRSSNNYVWEPQYENDYITDVIAVIGGGEPQELTINGRLYKKENQVCDLNKGGGGEYIWLYACREKYKESDGRTYYLTTGSVTDSPDRGTRVARKRLEDFDANKYVDKSYVDKGHKIVERVVVMYDKNGNFVSSQAEFNKGADGQWIKMIFAYATKEAGY